MKIHLMGICGTGMASVAGMLKEQGHEVRGSDQGIYPPMSVILEELGIPVLSPYDPKNLDPTPDQVVIGNALSRGNPEVEAVLSRGLPYLSMPQVLSEFFLPGKISLVVAGTHGKTTTTSLLAWVLQDSGRDPSFFVGGKPLNFPRNYRLGAGPHFVLEGDEYDTAFFDKGPKFLHYRPNCVLLTSLEFDHADIYKDLEQVRVSFRRLLEVLGSKGTLVANFDDPEVRALAEGFSGKVVSYGTRPELRETVDVFGEILSTGEKLRFCVLSRERGESCCHHEISWSLPGRHNVSNALGVIAVAFHLDLSWQDIQRGLTTFLGVRRRQEILGEVAGVTVVDDFAHHPTAVRETLQAIHERFPGRKLWAVFEPRSNSSKRDVFQEQYARAFSAAQEVILADVFMPEKVKDAQVLNVARLGQDIATHSGVRARHFSGTEAIVDCLLREVRSGDVILFMSNGAFGGAPQQTLKALAKGA